MSNGHARSPRRPPDRRAEPQDGPLGARLCARQHGEVLRLAERRPGGGPGGSADLDLRRLPSWEPGPDRRPQGPRGGADPRSRPDGDRQPGARPDPAGPLAGLGRARLRPSGRDDGADPGASGRRLRDRHVRGFRQGRGGSAAPRQRRPPAGPVRAAALAAPRRRAARNGRARCAAGQALLGPDRRGTRGPGGAVPGQGTGCARGRPPVAGRRRSGDHRRRGLLDEGLQLAGPAALRGDAADRPRQALLLLPRRHQGGGDRLSAACRRRANAEGRGASRRDRRAGALAPPRPAHDPGAAARAARRAARADAPGPEAGDREADGSPGDRACGLPGRRRGQGARPADGRGDAGLLAGRTDPGEDHPARRADLALVQRRRSPGHP